MREPTVIRLIFFLLRVTKIHEIRWRKSPLSVLFKVAYVRAKAMEPLENPEKQAPLGKWIPYLWIPPVALIVILGLFAYCAR